MGECCSKSTNDQTSELKTLDSAALQNRFTWRQIQLVIKVQARIRGLLARRRVKILNMQMGRSGGIGMSGNFGQMMSSNGEIVQDYNNEKVLVSKKTSHNILFVANKK